MSSNDSLSGGQHQPCCGPLGPHLEGFGTWLASQGYKPVTRRVKLRLCGDLDHWLEGRNIHLSDVNEDQFTVWLGSLAKRPVSAITTGQQLLAWFEVVGYV